jgi:hypothetical protein
MTTALLETCSVIWKTLKGITFTNVRFEVYMAVTMENAVLWDDAPCGSCKKITFQKNVALPSSG